MNWIVLERARKPDAAYWPGRGWLAAIDAIAWPFMAGLLLVQVPGRAGLFVPLAVAFLVLLGGCRLRRAVWLNHRYRFTACKVGRPVAALLIVGIVLKLALG